MYDLVLSICSKLWKLILSRAFKVVEPNLLRMLPKMFLTLKSEPVLRNNAKRRTLQNAAPAKSLSKQSSFFIIAIFIYLIVHLSTKAQSPALRKFFRFLNSFFFPIWNWLLKRVLLLHSCKKYHYLDPFWLCTVQPSVQIWNFSAFPASPRR